MMLVPQQLESFQRVGFLAYVPGLLRGFGVDPQEVLAAAGLDADALDNPESTIPYQAAGMLVQVSVERTRCPHFGLEIGRRVLTPTLGLLGQLMRNSPTLGVALRDFATHQHRNAHGAAVYFFKDERKATFGYAVYEPRVPGNQAICDAAAMALFSVVRELAGAGNASLLEVLISRAEPVDATPYRRAFGVKLSFDAEQTGVILPRGLLDQRIAGADAALHRTLEARVRATWHVGDLDTLSSVRRQLRVALLKGDASASEVAAELGMSQRTLSRRLEAQGLGFQKVLDEARCEFAQQLLASTRLGIAEIATIVGYSDPSVLTRAFSRWAEVTPSEWRASLGLVRLTLRLNTSNIQSPLKSGQAIVSPVTFFMPLIAASALGSRNFP